jgi:hypothetical protein
MTWLTSNMTLILGVLLVISEAIAALCQLLFPNNKGISGFIAGVIKFLQGLGAKPPGA